MAESSSQRAGPVAPPGPPPGAPPMGLPSRPPGPPPGAPSGAPPGPPFGGPSRQPPNVGYPGAPSAQPQGFDGWGGPPVGRGMGMPMGMGMRPPMGMPMMVPPPPSMMPNFPPPLPPGWSEHTAPDGVTRYYFNSQTKESTYVRPSFAPLPPAASPAPAVPAHKKKKEKPKDKVPVPGTTWTRITTTEGNVFYFERESKRSEWSVPDEIKGEVEELEAEEKRVKVEKEKAEEEKRKEERLERLREQERVRMEVEEERKKGAEKRKAQGDDGQGAKKVKREDGENGDAKVEEGEDVEKFGPQDEEDEADWMKAVAAEFAAADKSAAQKELEDKENTAKAEEEAAKKVFAVPDKVHVSPEEGKALFKALLMEKNISPFSTWEQSLPLFINDPRYVLLSSSKDREAVFDEYCRDAGRARRLNKAGPGATAKAPDAKKADPERDYKALLREDVTSTRTRWDDWRKKWKKDRRFYSYGRDDREREKMFKQHLKELGERELLGAQSAAPPANASGKRADAQRAEADFFDLLRESPNITSSSAWSEVKRSLSSDARYDAVGSSSLREELFQTYVRQIASSSTAETPEQAAERKIAERKVKQEASLRERQAQVGQAMEKVEKDVGRSRKGAGMAEGERVFGSLLVDQVKDHEVSRTSDSWRDADVKVKWEEASRFLSTDPRFNHPALHPADKRRLFDLHIAQIAGKRSNALFGLFQSNTPTLDTGYDAVYPKIIDDPIVQRLGLDVNSLEDRWKAWLAQRTVDARQQFDVMLGENSFVEFWGKMRKKEVDEEAAAAAFAKQDPEEKEDEDEDKEGLGEGGVADLTKLAQQIDLNEIKAVLRRDKRYRQFDHMPEEREQWIRDYLEHLQAASGSETIHQIG